MDSLQKLARRAGLLYLIIVICGFWGIMYAPSQVLVKNNAAETFKNLLTHEFIFRTGIISQLLSGVVFLLLVATFYRMFRDVNESQAKLMVIFVVVQIPITFLGESLNIVALMIVKGQLLQSSDLLFKEEISYLLLRIYRYGIIINMIFWGLWLIPLGQLVIKSGYLPRIIGILLIAGGWAYIIESIDYILLKEMLSPITNYTFILYSVAELSTVAWLLIKGIKTPK